MVDITHLNESFLGSSTIVKNTRGLENQCPGPKAVPNPGAHQSRCEEALTYIYSQSSSRVGDGPVTALKEKCLAGDSYTWPSLETAETII